MVILGRAARAGAAVRAGAAARGARGRGGPGELVCVDAADRLRALRWSPSRSSAGWVLRLGRRDVITPSDPTWGRRGNWRSRRGGADQQVFRCVGHPGPGGSWSPGGARAGRAGARGVRSPRPPSIEEAATAPGVMRRHANGVRTCPEGIRARIPHRHYPAGGLRPRSPSGRTRRVSFGRCRGKSRGETCCLPSPQGRQCQSHPDPTTAHPHDRRRVRRGRTVSEPADVRQAATARTEPPARGARRLPPAGVRSLPAACLATGVLVVGFWVLVSLGLAAQAAPGTAPAASELAVPSTSDDGPVPLEDPAAAGGEVPQAGSAGTAPDAPGTGTGTGTGTVTAPALPVAPDPLPPGEPALAPAPPASELQLPAPPPSPPDEGESDEGPADVPPAADPAPSGAPAEGAPSRPEPAVNPRPAPGIAGEGAAPAGSRPPSFPAETVEGVPAPPPDAGVADTGVPVHGPAMSPAPSALEAGKGVAAAARSTPARHDAPLPASPSPPVPPSAPPPAPPPVPASSPGSPAGGCGTTPHNASGSSAHGHDPAVLGDAKLTTAVQACAATARDASGRAVGCSKRPGSRPD